MTADAGEYPVSPFDRLHTAIAGSTAYREAVRATSPDVPEWLVPASVINIGDLETFAAELDVGDGQTIVDLGCGGGGPGLWVAQRTGASLIGVDASSEAVTMATALAQCRDMEDRARFLCADFGATGLPDECADGVMSLDALMFVDPHAAAHEIRRLLKRGARLVVRAVESLVDPFTPTLVRDYRPIFEDAGFAMLRHVVVADYRARSLAYFKAIEERADAMRAEIGSAADILIEEARDSLEKGKKAPRAQTVCFTAQR
ncbi:MAG TPA: class I SAM-dependent methyltransferase [Candidatus Eremiobacteraceae bacterium]